MEINFEVYENNGGGLFLFILDEEGTATAGFGNFEYQSGSLAEAIDALEKDPNAYKDFGGDFGGDIDLPPKYELNHDNYEYKRVGEMTVDEIYKETSEDETSTLIAWVDNGEVVYCNHDRMGYAAKSALNIPDEE